MKSWLSSQNAARKTVLIVGLGNPGSAYEKTRHNAGFRVVRTLAKRHGIRLRKKVRLGAEFGEGAVGPCEVGILLPMIYMNRSGFSVAKAMKAYGVDRLIVVVDDIAFPVGTVRLKESGSSGGHNGLKSIEECLRTQQFARLRIGIGHPQGANLADYVLSPFDEEEEKALPQVFNHAADKLEEWIEQGKENDKNK